MPAVFSALYRCCNVNFVAKNTIYVVCLLKECCACMRACTYVREEGRGGEGEEEEKREENRRGEKRGGREHESQGQGMPVHVAVRGQPCLCRTSPSTLSEVGSPLYCTHACCSHSILLSSYPTIGTLRLQTQCHAWLLHARVLDVCISSHAYIASI